MSAGDATADRDTTALEVDVLPLQAEGLSAACTCAQKEEQGGVEAGFVLLGQRKELRDLLA